MQLCWRKYKGDLILVLVTVIWGTTFALTKMAVQEISPLLYLALRFVIGFLALATVFGKRLLTMNRRTVLGGVVVGAILFLGFALQTSGMQDPDTSASKSGFITGMSVIFTPLLSVLFLKRKPTLYAVIGAACAFIGLGFLSLDGSFNTRISWGDILTLLCAMAFAGHIVAVGKFASNVDTGAFTTLQIGVVGVLCIIAGLTTEPMPQKLSTEFWWGLAYMATLATAGTLLMQNWAQKFTSPTRAAIIFTLEPVFAALFAFMVLNETMSSQSLFGALLILVGISLAEYSPGSEDCEEQEVKISA